MLIGLFAELRAVSVADRRLGGGFGGLRRGGAVIENPLPRRKVCGEFFSPEIGPELAKLGAGTHSGWTGARKPDGSALQQANKSSSCRRLRSAEPVRLRSTGLGTRPRGQATS